MINGGITMYNINDTYSIKENGLIKMVGLTLQELTETIMNEYQVKHVQWINDDEIKINDHIILTITEE